MSDESWPKGVSGEKLWDQGISPTTLRKVAATIQLLPDHDSYTIFAIELERAAERIERVQAKKRAFIDALDEEEDP